jgi:hypothetical protein
LDEGKREQRRADRAGSAAKLRSMMTDRSRKATAPEPAQPKGRYATKAEVLAAFRERRDATIRYVEQTEDDLRGRMFAGAAGEMDLYEFLLVISAHTERHLAQMKEVMESPGFPRS